MVLRETHLATWQINWDDKATNLRRIAQDLNIGLDTLVFVDDNQFECDLVLEQLPQVAVLRLSGDPSTFRSKLGAAGFFDALTFSAEDRERTQMYHDDWKWLPRLAAQTK
jgi:FkbH-like protein